MESIKEFDSGLLICPKCGANNMGGFKKWKSRIQINNSTQLIETFILYESKTSCICCCLCSTGKEISKNENIILLQDNTEIRDINTQTNIKTAQNSSNKEKNSNKCYICFIGCFCLLIGLLLELICYPLCGLWCDLCNCCCHIAKKYKNLRSYDKKLKKVVTYDNFCYSNIWEHIDGMTVETINKDKISICLNCKYEKEFIDFLPKEKQIKLRTEKMQNNNTRNNNDQNILNNQIINNDNQNIDSKDKIINKMQNKISNYDNQKDKQIFYDDVETNKSDESEDNDNPNKVDMKNIISINFSSQQLNINYNMPCLNSIKFRECLEKLFNEYPEIRNKKIYCLANGTRIEEDKTMLENKIKSGTEILIYEHSTCISSDKINI